MKTNAIRSLIVLFACCSMCVHTYAQAATRTTTDTTKNKQTSKPVFTPKPKGSKPITNELSFGYRINTDGWSFYTDFGKVTSKTPKQSDMWYDVRFLQLEFSEKKDPAEQKVTADDGYGNQTKYRYGKINNFYGAKLGLGFRKMLAGKPDPGTVSIHWVGVIGGSLGLLKPYYLKVFSDPSAIKYSDNTQNDFLNQQVIMGSAGFSKGFDQLSFIPGGHLKSAVHFDFSTNRKNAVAVEVGFNLEYYSKPVPILANQKPVPYFMDLFMAFQYGRRW
ncbi:MAG: hypothetical protein JWQ38_351 [Flavipsychrobacter sp.]|nr:hypothetical protein [Flavipsychrobacter sp.]